MSQVYSRDSSDDDVTVLSSRTVIRGGTLSVTHDLTVRGVVEGEVKVGGKVVVAAGAEVDGQLQAREAVIAGHVRGELVVKETLTLRSTAVLDGTASATRLVVEEGSAGSVSLQIGGKEFFDLLEQRRSEARAELERVRSRSRSESDRSEGDDSVPSGSEPRASSATPTDVLIASREMQDFLAVERPDNPPAETPLADTSGRQENAD
jgi:cytoskeletal protein CcmA (bactofilin family)